MTRYVGKAVRFIATSDDFTNPTEITILDENNETVILGAGQRLAILTLNYNCGTNNQRITLFDDASEDDNADAEEILDRVSCSANTSYSRIFPEPLLCGRARNPKIIAVGESPGSSVTGTGLVID